MYRECYSHWRVMESNVVYENIQEELGRSMRAISDTMLSNLKTKWFDSPHILHHAAMMLF